jgi:hypothetical protein
MILYVCRRPYDFNLTTTDHPCRYTPQTYNNVSGNVYAFASYIRIENCLWLQKAPRDNYLLDANRQPIAMVSSPSLSPSNAAVILTDCPANAPNLAPYPRLQPTEFMSGVMFLSAVLIVLSLFAIIIRWFRK